MTAIRVLVCEDSRLYVMGLRRLLEYDQDISVAGVCASAEEAVAALPALRPDLVTMDIELPGMDGLTAVEKIMSSRPLPILVLSAHVAGVTSEKAAAALAVGALDAVAKDDLDLRDPAGATAVAFRRRVRVLSRARVIRHLRGRPGLRPGAQGPGRRASAIGVCASTGGPHVVARLLEALPADFPIPLLIVQHIGDGFTDGLSRWLDQTVQLPVAVARGGSVAGCGAWIAPDGAHLKLTAAGLLSLDRRTVAGHYRPSGDVLLESIAESAGSAGVAVVLSGMGTDVAAGAAAVRGKGGLAIAQDQESSAVFGMPKAAIELGVDLVLPPAEIAAVLANLRHQPLQATR
jgi:two-component system, chemotaxis family, protein-glutamate methylesterase/glutaminase